MLASGPQNAHRTEAVKPSNITAEIAAVYHSAQWLLSISPPPPVATILLDRLYAANTIRGLWRARTSVGAVFATHGLLHRLYDAGAPSPGCTPDPTMGMSAMPPRTLLLFSARAVASPALGRPPI